MRIYETSTHSIWLPFLVIVFSSIFGLFTTIVLRSAIIVFRGGINNPRTNYNRLPRYHTRHFPRPLRLQARRECPVGGDSHLRLEAWWWPCSILDLSCWFETSRIGSAIGQIQPRGARRQSALSKLQLEHSQRINVIVLVCMVCTSIVAYILFHIEERIQRRSQRFNMSGA